MQAITRFVWLMITLFVLAGVASFAVSNKAETVLAFWPLGDVMQLPLWAVVLGALCAGLMLGAVLVWLAGLPQRSRLRARDKRIAKLEIEVARLTAEKEETEPAADRKPALPGQAS